MNDEEYRRRVKELIKKYHPDLTQDDALRPVLTEITARLTAKLSQPRNQPSVPRASSKSTNGISNTLSATSDQGYAYYRAGIENYRNIHPGKFYKRDSESPFQMVDFDNPLKVLQKILLSFRLAEHCFRTVIVDYPDSQWVEDSKAKIGLLKKLWKSYEGRVAEENPSTIDAKGIGDFMRKMGLRKG